MYQDQHIPWQPGVLLIGDSTLGDDLCIAAFSSPDGSVDYDLDNFDRAEVVACWIIAEMIGIAPGRLSNDSGGDDEADCSH